MRLTIIFLSLLVFAGMLSPALKAQELPKAKKYEGVKWYGAVYWKWKSGKAQEGRKIVHDHLLPAAKAAGLKQLHFHFTTGEWSGVRYVPLDEGPSALEWQVRPNTEKFWAELAKREGGAEKALEMIGKVREDTAHSKVEIVRLYVSE